MVGARTFSFAAVARAGVTGAVGSGQRGQWAGVRARQRGAAGAFSRQGSREWARVAGGQLGGGIGRRRGAVRRAVGRQDCVPAWSLWRRRGVALQCVCAPEPPLPRAMGRTCAGSAAATAVPRAARCAARYARSVTCVLDAQTAQYRVRHDIFLIYRACMSGMRMFELSESRGLMCFQYSIIDFRSTDTHMQGSVHAARLAAHISTGERLIS